jgi:hypothetical protein
MAHVLVLDDVMENIVLDHSIEDDAPFLIRIAYMFAGALQVKLEMLLRRAVVHADGRHEYDLLPELYGPYMWVMNALVHGGILRINDEGRIAALNVPATIKGLEYGGGVNMSNPFSRNLPQVPGNEGVELAFVMCLIAVRTYNRYDSLSRRRTHLEIRELNLKVSGALRALVTQLHEWHPAFVSDQAMEWVGAPALVHDEPDINDEVIHDEQPQIDRVSFRENVFLYQEHGVKFVVRGDGRNAPKLWIRIAYMYAGLLGQPIQTCLKICGGAMPGSYLLRMKPAFYTHYTSAMAFLAYTFLDKTPDNRNFALGSGSLPTRVRNLERLLLFSGRPADISIELALANYMVALAVYGRYDNLARRKTRYEVEDHQMRVNEACAELAFRIYKWNEQHMAENPDNGSAITLARAQQLFPWYNF